MGFSVVATVGILMTGALIGGGVYLQGMDSRDDAVNSARQDADLRAATIQRADATIVGAVYTGLPLWNLVVTAINTGDVNLDAGSMDVLVDGALANDDVSLILIDGVSTDIWAPLGTAVITITGFALGPVPQRVALAFDNGLIVFGAVV